MTTGPTPVSSPRGDAIQRVLKATLIAAAILAANRAASAGSDTVGVTLTSDRDPNDFAVPKDFKYELSEAHTFDNGLIWGGSFQYTDNAFSLQASQNLESTVGYRLPLGTIFSVNGSAGLGEHWRETPSTYFPYYVLRIGADVEINDWLTWNAISYRYRDAWDHTDNYDTPQLATGVSFKLAAQSSIAVKIMRNWKNGEPSSTGLSLGFRQRF
jgi:hypothetical protein